MCVPVAVCYVCDVKSTEVSKTWVQTFPYLPVCLRVGGRRWGINGSPWCMGGRKRPLVNGSPLPDVSYDAPQDGCQRGWSHRQYIFLCLIESNPTFFCLQCYQGNVRMYVHVCVHVCKGMPKILTDRVQVVIVDDYCCVHIESLVMLSGQL